jgi:uncharacterized protein
MLPSVSSRPSPENCTRSMRLETVSTPWLARLRARKPKVHCHDSPRNRALIASLSQLREGFRPTPWLFNEHLQLVALSARRRTNERPYCRAEPLIMADGGYTALVWRGYDLPETTPTIVVLPTITGSPDSMAELVDDLHGVTGFRVVLCLRRGHGDLPLTTPRINIFGSTDDLREQLACIRGRFPASALYGVGSSAGSGLLVRYLGEEGEAAPFEAAFAYCPGYDTDAVFDTTHPVYSRYMTRKLVRQFITPHEDKLRHLKTAKLLKAAESLSEFHRSMYELAGYESYDDYAAASNPMRVFESVRTPMMILNAEDDPVCRIENVEPYLEAIARMPNTILVTTERGSHCAHYQGWAPRSWAGRLIANYFLVMRGSAGA